MNYEQARAFHAEISRDRGCIPGLDGIRVLMRELGNPQEQLNVIHIAGTNGKGSVGAMIASVLTEAGIRTGHFSSPAVFDFEEEWRIDGKKIGKARLAELFTEVHEACVRMTLKGLAHPTSFEIETAAAFLYFAQEHCDAIVLECGMGGALDSTNVIRCPLLCVITSISRDHVRFLGSSLASIARMKAGIIKDARPVVTVRQESEVAEVLLDTCRARGSRLILADESLAIHRSVNRAGTSFDLPDVNISDVLSQAVKEGPESFSRYHLGMTGTFQVENGVCAVQACRLLQQIFAEDPVVQGGCFTLTDEDIHNGLSKVHWYGRFERIGEHPDFVIDGAHNASAARRLRETADLVYGSGREVQIMGVLADKSFEDIVRIMCRPDDIVFTVTPDNPRALAAEELCRVIRTAGVRAECCKTVREAVRRSYRAAACSDFQDNDHILAFGSLSYLREVRNAVQSGD